MTLLELVMIVKNGADTIVPVLEAIRPHIDSWTILDTGSTDNTRELITSTLRGVPGQLREEPFVDFKTSRNRVLHLAGKKCKYTIMLDDSYVLQGGSELRKILAASREDGLALRITDEKESAEYFSLRILRTHSEIRYKYRIHEIPDYENALNISESEIKILDLTTSRQRKRSYARFQEDLKMLLLEHRENPRDSRIVRYLGTTCHSLNRHQEAYEWFSKLLAMKNITDEEKYTALVHSAELLYKDLGGTHQDYIKLLERAALEIPYRAESYYKLAIVYRNLGFNELALKWITMAANIPVPVVIEPIDISVYKKDIPYLLIEICLQMKYIEKIVPLVKKMLSLYPTEQRFLNIKHAISTPEKKTLKKLEKPVIVFHLGDEDDICNPRDSKSQLVSYTQRLGAELLKNNYRVIIFANFGKFEGSYEGIDYIHNAYFSEFVDSYVINVLIATSGKNMCLYDNIDRVYLWPFLNYEEEEFIQIHPLKFKGVLTFSDYQGRDIQKSWMVPDAHFIKTPYAVGVPSPRESGSLEKVANRFVCQVDSDSELQTMYALWPSIREKYPDASLVVVSENPQSPLDDSVRVVSEMSSELDSASVWISLRPERRSYSPEALKARVAGCLCMGVNSGPMLEIIGGGRGVLFSEYSEEKKRDILDRIFLALDNQTIRNVILKKAEVSVEEVGFEKCARELCKVLLRS